MNGVILNMIVSELAESLSSNGSAFSVEQLLLLSTFKTKNVLCGFIGRRSNDIFTDAFFCIAGGQIQTFSKICLKKMIAKYSSL